MTLSIKGNLVENNTEEAPTNAEFNNARCSILSNEPIKNNDLIKYIKFTSFEELEMYYDINSRTYQMAKGIFSANSKSNLSRINGNMLFIVPYQYTDAKAGTITTSDFESRFKSGTGEGTTYNFSKKKGFLTIQHLNDDGEVLTTYKNYLSFNKKQGQSMEKIVELLNKEDFDCDFELVGTEIRITDHSFGAKPKFKIIATTLTTQEIEDGYVDFASDSYFDLIDEESEGGAEGDGENPVEILNRFGNDKDEKGNKVFYTYHFTTTARMSADNLLALKQQIAENNQIATNERYCFFKAHQGVADSRQLKDSKDLTFSLVYSYNDIFDSGVLLSFVLGRKVSEEDTYSLSFHNPYKEDLQPSAIKTIGQQSATFLTSNNAEYIGYFDLNAGWLIKGRERGSQSEDNANIQDFYYNLIPLGTNYAESVGGLWKTMQTIKDFEFLLYSFAGKYKEHHVIGAVPEEELQGVPQNIADSIQSRGVYFEMPKQISKNNVLTYKTYLGINGKYVKFSNHIVVYNSK